MVLTTLGGGFALLLLRASYGRLNTLTEAVRRARQIAAIRCTLSEGEQRQRVADINEMTLELRQVLSAAKWVPRSCARIAFAAGALVAIVQGAEALVGAGAGSWGSGAGAIACAVFGAIGCTVVGRLAEQKARNIREEWNTLIRRSTQDVPTNCRVPSCGPARQLIS